MRQISNSLELLGMIVEDDISKKDLMAIKEWLGGAKILQIRRHKGSSWVTKIGSSLRVSTNNNYRIKREPLVGYVNMYSNRKVPIETIHDVSNIGVVAEDYQSAQNYANLNDLGRIFKIIEVIDE